MFSGGAFRGPAFFGTIRALQECKSQLDLRCVVADSIGAMYGLFYILDIPWNVVLEKYLKLDLERLFEMENVLESQSLTSQRNFKKSILDAIREKMDSNTTFMELKKATGIDFVCNAVNVDTKQHVYFNPKDTPEVKVIDAVMASSCLPFMFQPVVINGERYYDGGICNSCPVEYVSETSTIAFSVYVKGSDGGSRHPLNALLKTVTHLLNENKQCDNVYYILEGSTVNFHDLMFKINQTRDEIFTLYMYGYKKSLEVLHQRNSITYVKT